MKVSSNRIRRSLMVGLLGALVYQGFLVSAKAERYMRLESETIFSEVEDRPRINMHDSNAASLYYAAMELQARPTDFDQRTVDFNTLAEHEEVILETLTLRHQSLELLQTASSLPLCQFPDMKSTENDTTNYQGARRLVQQASLAMMLEAKAGRHEAAIALGHDLATFNERLEANPNLIAHAFCLELANQLHSTATELRCAYPGGGYEALQSDLMALSEKLGRGLRLAIQNERRLTVETFEQLRAEPEKFTRSYAYRFFDLPAYQSEIEYLKVSEAVEKAVDKKDPAAISAALKPLAASESLAGVFTPAWDAVFSRHQEITLKLKG